MTQPVTETYRDRFEWDAQFCAAGCRVRGFLSFALLQHKNMLVIISQHSRLSIKI